MTTLTFASYLAPIMRPVYQWLTDSVGRTLGCETRLVVGSSYEEIVEGQVDVAFICGWPYIRLADRPSSPVELLAAPVLCGSEHDGDAHYCSRVIVYLATLDHLLRDGERSNFFGRMVEAGWHEESIRLVRSGEIDASAIDCQVLDVAMRRDPSLASAVRVLTTFRSAPIQPVVAGRHLPEALRKAIRGALLDATSDPDGRDQLARGHVQGFLEVDDAAYDTIRERARAVQAAGLL